MSEKLQGNRHSYTLLGGKNIGAYLLERNLSYVIKEHKNVHTVLASANIY